MKTVNKTWYFLEPKSKFADVYNILHLPYTAMALSIVLAGAAVSPAPHLDRVAGSLGAYFFGLGFGAHALDQLEPHGSHYVEKLSRSDLAVIGGAGLGLGVAVGVYFSLTVTLLLIPLTLAGAFFAVAYTLPSRVARGAFHNNLSFAFSWGVLPFFTSYFVNSLEVSAVEAAGCAVAGLAAWGEIRLSRRARALRSHGTLDPELHGVELRLKLLVAATCAASMTLALYRLA